MGWQLRRSQMGWTWDWRRPDPHYSLFTYLPDQSRTITLRLNEHRKDIITAQWDQEWCDYPAGVSRLDRAIHIRAGTADRVHEPPEWADDLVSTGMDMLAAELACFQLQSFGSMVRGWKRVMTLKDGRKRE